MASVLKVDKLDPQSGTALEIGTSGDTISVPSGATLDISASTLTPPATMPASSGVNLTALNATNLGSGTVPDARFPATLPTASGVNLTALNATNLGSGTVPDARFPATLPTASGVNLTALNATNLGSGTVPTARLGTGTASSSTILYGDNTWAAAAGGKILQVVFSSTTDGSTATTSEDPTFVQCSTPTAVITLASTSSKVLLIGNAVGQHAGDALFRDFYREISGGSTTANISGFRYGIGWTSSQATDSVTTLIQSQSISWVDSPSTTSEITYSLSLCNNNGSTTVTLYQQRYICAIEIGA